MALFLKSRVVTEKIKKLQVAFELIATGRIFRILFGRQLASFRRFFSPSFFTKIDMLLLLGYWPDLKHPRSFNEKIQHRKLFAPHPLSTLVADKWAVREFVASQCGLASILNEIYFVGSDPEKIPFDDFPDKFVIKATHGSGWNIFIRDKNKMNRGEVVAQCRKWLGLKYSRVSCNFYETHYDQIPPQVIVERFIEDPCLEVPLDYKLFVFSGHVQYVQVDSGRFTEHRRNFFNREWKEQDFCFRYPKAAPVDRPKKFEEMIGAAERLARDFDFCRVDLYCAGDGRIIFGEMTLAPESGCGRFYPREWDFKLGALWDMKLV